MRVVWKFGLQLVPKQEIMLPKGSEILCVQTQQGLPCMWAMVDRTRQPVRRLIRTFGTGHPMDFIPTKYIGTYQVDNGNEVYHVWDDGELI
jgi:hypothetical protein